jgi:hypothetical protein
VVRFAYAPSGLLGETLLANGAVALVAGMAVFFAAGRRLEAGVGASALAMIGMEFLLQH